MRVASAFLVIGVLSAGGAEASSFVVLPAMTDHLGPSMIAIGQTATPDVTVAAAIPVPSQPPVAEPGQVKILSPSIIALGEPAVADENVGAIGTEPKKRGPNTGLMVIRGGVVGDAFSPAATGAPVALPTDPETAAQAPSSGAAPEPASSPQAPEQAAQPVPSAPAVAPE